MQGDALLACSLLAALMLSDWLSPLMLRTLLQRCGEIAPEDIAGLNSRSSTQPTRVDTFSIPAQTPHQTPHQTPTLNPAQLAAQHALMTPM
jgi:hypothetical protein